MKDTNAAAVAYGLDKYSSQQKNILILDIGGGTFNVSVVILEDGIVEINSTNGNNHLGGEDFDNLLVDYCVSEFK
jgi:heat shock 70kDa protein 1/2/6/8